MWRVAISVPFIETLDEEPINDKSVLPVIKERLARILPGNTDDIIYLQAAPYTIHQRVVSKYRSGNVLLADDAAHLNNPVGGLGCDTGILDAAHLAKALTEVLTQNAPNTVLDEYARARREVFTDITDSFSTANLLRLKGFTPEDVAAREDFFKMLNDPNEGNRLFAYMAREMGISTMLNLKDLGVKPEL